MGPEKGKWTEEGSWKCVHRTTDRDDARVKKGRTTPLGGLTDMTEQMRSERESHMMRLQKERE